MKNYLPVLVIGFLLFSCATKPRQERALQNLTSLYNPTSSPIHPELAVFHAEQFQSLLYVKLYTVELLFNQANEEGTFQSRVKIHYELRELEAGKESELISDSATSRFTLRMEKSKNVYVLTVPLKTQEYKQYLMKVNITDLLRNKSVLKYILVDRSSNHTAQYFFLENSLSGIPAFNPVFRSADSFNIRYNRSGVDSLFISYFQNDFPLPRPPITNLASPRPEFRADSVFVISHSDTMKYNIPLEGMYHFQVDPNQPDGLSLFNFGKNYPKVATVEEMIAPLAYLSSTIEFNELISQTNKKLAVDNFWLKAAGNPQSARELIRIYYNRVYLSNFFFTSYKEGWKTDRGMMFIVYGPPNLLTKRGHVEIWVYYRKKSAEPLQFTFTRHENRFTHNDYLLERNFVNSMWVQAVDDWQKGKIFYTGSY